MNELSQYAFRCRRGMKELDVVLEHYLKGAFRQADVMEKQCFDELLELQDPQLFAWIFELEAVPKHYQALTAKIRQFS